MKGIRFAYDVNEVFKREILNIHKNQIEIYHGNNINGLRLINTSKLKELKITDERDMISTDLNSLKRLICTMSDYRTSKKNEISITKLILTGS